VLEVEMEELKQGTVKEVQAVAGSHVQEGRLVMEISVFPGKTQVCLYDVKGKVEGSVGG